MREIQATTAEADFVRLTADIDDRALGPKLRNKKGAVKAAIKALTDAEIRAVQAAGKITVEGFDLTVAELVIVREFQGDQTKLEPAWNDEVLTVLDVVVTNEMRDEGTARSVANVVQKLRKASGVQPSDDIALHCVVNKPGSQGLPAMLAHWSDFIAKKLGRPFLLVPAEEVSKHKYLTHQEFTSFGDCVFTIYITTPAGK